MADTAYYCSHYKSYGIKLTEKKQGIITQCSNSANVANLF